MIDPLELHGEYYGLNPGTLGTMANASVFVVCGVQMVMSNRYLVYPFVGAGGPLVCLNIRFPSLRARFIRCATQPTHPYKMPRGSHRDLSQSHTEGLEN